MKTIITIIISLIIFCPVYSYSQDTENSNHTEELLSRLKETKENDSTRLYLYQELYNISIDSAKIIYTDKLLKEAELQNNAWYLCQGYLNKMSQAYNCYNVAEVNKWMAKLEPLAKKEGFLDFLFQGKRCVIDMLMVNGEYEKEEQEAENMLKEAKKVKNQLGVILANICLSNVLRITKRNDEAAIALTEAYDVAIQLDNQIIYEINNSLISVNEELGDYNNWLKWIVTMDKYLQKQISKDPQMEYKMRVWLLMTHVSYVKYYTKIRNYSKAEDHVKLMNGYRTKDSNINEYYYYWARLNYYKASGKLKEAVAETDSLMQIFKEISLLSYIQMRFTKAQLLTNLGNHDDAIILYRELFEVSDSANMALVNKQVKHLQLEHNSNLRILDREQDNRNIQILLFLLVLGVIGIIFVFASTTRKVQRNLRKQEEEMRKMAESMEQANIAKETFLATISSSIKDPLNIVVKGALQLATNEINDKEMRKHISENLKTTSNDLMILINNILSLSRLETGMIKLNLESIDIHSFLSNTQFIAESKGETINLDTTDMNTSVTVHFDMARLTEIFNSLLIPAIPSKGITLKVQTATENKNVVFTVNNTILAGFTLENQPQNIAMSNEVNRLLIKHLGGNYEILHAPYSYIVKFSLPAGQIR